MRKTRKKDCQWGEETTKYTKYTQKSTACGGIKPQKTQNDTEKHYAQSHMQSCGAAAHSSFIIHHSYLGTAPHMQPLFHVFYG